ncbi:hypothetical protein JQ553_05605 [Bradyrhizobium lablabi]|nr:hypothetical protein [Bradyrhizobium lablabi]
MRHPVRVVEEDTFPLPWAEPSRARSAVAEMSSAVKDAVDRVGDAVEAGRRAGMPVDAVSRVARVTPLASLLIAFLSGVAYARY